MSQTQSKYAFAPFRLCVLLVCGAMCQAGIMSAQTRELSLDGYNDPEKSSQGTSPKDSTASSDSEQEKATEGQAQVKPLTEKMQAKLLGARLNGGMGYSFRQFANQFFVTSRIHFGTGVGLMTSSEEISETQLMSPFPESYEPTLREFLDAIALQTSSEWNYDPTNQFIKSEVETDKPLEGFAIFEFKPSKRKKPYTVTLAEGWKTVDHGHWVMHVPPNFPVGMDIYEMGTYSANEKEENFSNKIRKSVALEWAQRVNEKAMPGDLKPAKVGQFDALYYESMVPSQLGEDIKWRHWVFMSEQRCFFVVSTILPDKEKSIYPDVQKMLKSFRVAKTTEDPKTP